MDKQLTRAFAERIFSDMAAAMTCGMAYVGAKTGLFKAMSGKGPMTIDGVMRESGLNRRYVEEWLKGMSSAGYLAYDPHAATYALPDEHAYLLAADGTDHDMAGLFGMAPVLLRVAPKVADAFRNGGGVRFEEFGEDCIEGLDIMNRGTYETRFADYWLKALPDVVSKLEKGGRVLDMGCGVGRVSLALSKAFPQAEVVGIDLDQKSIDRAARVAADRGLAGRVRFVAEPVSELEAGEGFDLITACDCIHDFSAPDATLRDMRRLLKKDGVLFIMEPKAADRPEDNRNSIATMYYGFSIFHCMTQSLADGGPGLGTCMGPALTAKLVKDAGFSCCDPLDIKSQVSLFYAARP